MARKRKIEIKWAKDGKERDVMIQVSGRTVHRTTKLSYAIAFIQGYTKRDDISEDDNCLRWYF